MPDHLIPMRCDLLQPGMYVAELDRSWLHTPFTGHGFLISQRAQIESLKMHCVYVYIDPERSEPGALSAPLIASDEQTDRFMAPEGDSALVPVRAELGKLIGQMASTIRTARSSGRIDVVPLMRCAALLAGLASRHKDELLWLLTTERADSLLHRRAVGTAALAVMFGRHLGFDAVTLRRLALGGLLLDIGKITVPMPILVKPRSLTPAERVYARRHVNRGMEILRRDADIPEEIAQMILGHHERIDGSGYPRGLRGTRIPLFARIAAIVDTFDAITLNRRYARGLSAHDALRFMSSLRGSKFDSALTGEFVHALGIFPTGTCVELINGSIGLVRGQHPDWPLQPDIVVVRDFAGRIVDPLRFQDDPMHTGIVKTLPPAALNLAPGQLEHAFDLTGVAA